ncbi:MAG: hypothetical protein WCF64_10025, partial [Methylocella sp.]
SLRVPSLLAQAGKAVKQIGTFCSSCPIMRRPMRRAGRAEKRATRGNEKPPIAERRLREQLDSGGPNQNGL